MLDVSGQFLPFLPFSLHDCLGHFLQLTALAMLRAKKVRVIQGHFLDSFPFGAKKILRITMPHPLPLR